MLCSRILETMTRSAMVRPGDRVLVGLSGGADSVALSELLVELAPRLGISLGLAHLNHALRPDADEDEAFCRELAERLSLPFVAGRIDVRSLAEKSKRSLEDEGRRARYGFLDAQADRLGCRRIAVGHTLDDQAETFLLRLLRGSGGKGLASVHPVVEPRRIRPLLNVRRGELRAYLEARELPFRDDPTNADLRFTRNRIRHETLPRLLRDFNPRLVETLARSASILREEDDWMEDETKRVFEELASESDDMVRLDACSLRLRHPALAKRLVRLAVGRLRGLENVGHGHIEDVLSLTLPGRSGREVHLPGLVAERAFGEIRIRRGSGRAQQNGRERGYNGFEYRLSIPARVRIPEGGGTLSARLSSESGRPDGSVSPAAGNRVIVGIEGHLSELKVRSPRPGDRFHPLGAPGSKPLARYLMERKVSRGERRSHPLVVRGAGEERGEILWVVGYAVSEASRVEGSSRWLSLEWVAS